MDDQLQEFARDLEDRALTYGFLARALADEDVTLDFLRALAADVPQTGTELDSFAASLVGLDDDALVAARREVCSDHAFLLLAMSEDPISPFESVYTSEEHIMMQDSRDEVVAAYRASGFGKSDDYHMPEDHISLELDFMAGLGMRAYEAVSAVLEGSLSDEDAAEKMSVAEVALNAQVDFLEKHLLVWTGQFCDQLEKRSKSGFYKGAAQMLRMFLEQEREYVAQLNAAAQ